VEQVVIDTTTEREKAIAFGSSIIVMGE